MLAWFVDVISIDAVILFVFVVKVVIIGLKVSEQRRATARDRVGLPNDIVRVLKNIAELAGAGFNIVF